MARSEAQKRATAKWDAEHTEKVTIKLNKDTGPTKEQIRAAAERDGLTMSAWIIQRIRDAL